MELVGVESFGEQILENSALAIELTVEALVIGIQDALQECTGQPVVIVAKNVNCHLNQRGTNLFFVVIVLGTR